MVGIEWTFKMHISGDEEHSILYRNDTLGLQKEIHTLYLNGQPGKGQIYFFIDGDKRTFRQEKKLIKAIGIKQRGKK